MELGSPFILTSSVDKAHTWEPSCNHVLAGTDVNIFNLNLNLDLNLLFGILSETCNVKSWQYVDQPLAGMV